MPTTLCQIRTYRRYVQVQNICLDYSQLNFCTNSNCHIIITHLNSFLSCFILIFLLLRCTAAKLPKEQTGQRNCCCCRYTGPHIQQQQVGPKVSLFKFQDLGVWPEPASPGITAWKTRVRCAAWRLCSGVAVPCAELYGRIEELRGHQIIHIRMKNEGLCTKTGPLNRISYHLTRGSK